MEKRDRLKAHAVSMEQLHKWLDETYDIPPDMEIQRVEMAQTQNVMYVICESETYQDRGEFDLFTTEPMETKKAKEHRYKLELAR